MNKLPHSHGTCANVLLKSLPGNNQIQSVADAMRQLGDPVRLRIFWILCHCEECVINIAALMDMSSPAVYHHLKLLKDANLIVSRREGKEAYYRASDTELAGALHEIIENIAEITCPK